MEKKKTFATAIWLIALAVWFGIYRFAQYKIDMYYSKLAPQQFEDDSTYGQLKFQSTANTVTLIVFAVFALLIVYQIYRVWRKTKDKESEE